MSTFIFSIFTIVLQNITYLGCMLYLSGEYTLKSLLPPPEKLLLSFIAFNFLVSLIQIYDNQWILLGLFLVFLLYIVFLYINTSKSISQCCNIALFGYLLASLCQGIGIVLFNLLHIPYNPLATDNFGMCLIILLGSLILAIFLYFCPVHIVMDKLEKISYFSSLCTVSIIIVIALVSAYHNKYMTSGLLISSLSTAILFIGVGELILYQSFQDQKRKQALHEYETYLPILDQMIQNVQKNQHRYNNQISSIVHLADVHSDYDSLCAALDEFSTTTRQDSDESYYDFLHLENKLLASLLYCKIQKAYMDGKHIVVDVTDYSFESNCTDLEIVDIAGILLDNALEAIQPDQSVYVTIGDTSIQKENRKFRISVQNPGPAATDEFIHNIFRKKFTTKKNTEGHGLGLAILQSSVNKYHGTITVSNSYPEGEEGDRYLMIEVEV